MFPCQKGKRAIYCNKNNGPCFGGDQAELSIWSDRNGNFKSLSRTGQSVYKIGRNEEDGKNMLTNEKDDYFTITEIEVW